MNKKLKTIMLVDDDANTNLLNEIIISKMNIAEEIIIFQNGKLALDFLTVKNKEEQFPQPDIILLDINMPLMNGWDFIEEYKKIDKDQKAGILVVMLTSSINYEDRDRALNSGVVTEFINKPLDEIMIREIIEKHITLDN